MKLDIQVTKAGTGVAPRAGAWIETYQVILQGKGRIMSLLAQERGLKPTCVTSLSFFHVAPRAGAWIETFASWQNFFAGDVAPRAGAWIETRSFADWIANN